jgi:hypothetical protein
MNEDNRVLEYIHWQYEGIPITLKRIKDLPGGHEITFTDGTKELVFMNCLNDTICYAHSNSP